VRAEVPVDDLAYVDGKPANLAACSVRRCAVFA
jgi:hypothetical protein